jgi:hypothetical protein
MSAGLIQPEGGKGKPVRLSNPHGPARIVSQR